MIHFKHPVHWFYLVFLFIGLIFCIYFSVIRNLTAIIGVCLWGLLILALFACRPNSVFHQISTEKTGFLKNISLILVICITIGIAVIPMSFDPLWNGKQPAHRNQYELLAESFLDGKLYIEYGDEEELLLLNNPYDTEEREETGITGHWDHAYYNGRYYMYFGVVPVILLFLPFRLLTGSSLTTYHATQIFAAFFILGMFALFHLLNKKFFKTMPLGMYLLLSSSLSIASIWLSMSEPALYCTAIISAICLEVWSIYFFCKAVWTSTEENLQLRYATIGALLGALTFGCRPPVGIANLIVLPCLHCFLKQRKFTFQLFRKLVLAASPYFFVALILMAYNYARFEDPFEFGQSFQLTVCDQRNLGNLSDPAVRIRLVNETIQNFVKFTNITDTFPYIKYSGIFFNFPIFLFILGFLRESVQRQIKEMHLTFFLITLAVIPLITTLLSVLWSPTLTERYRMDIYYLVSILCFISLGSLHNVSAHKGKLYISSFASVFAVLTFLSSFLLFLRSKINDLPLLVHYFQNAFSFWQYF